MSSKIAVVALVVILAAVNWSIYGKEQHLAQGTVVYLQLAPVDPRSLMQGDYMALRFRVANEIYQDLPKLQGDRRWRQDVAAADGYAIVVLDEKGIGTFKAVHDGQRLASNEIMMRYRVRNGEVRFATNAFFFQEGDAELYTPARYGQFRVDKKGELLLTGMYDEQLNRIGR